MSTSSPAPLGQCPKCQQSNPYSASMCSFCGEILPWAAARRAVRAGEASVPPSGLQAPPKQKISQHPTSPRGETSQSAPHPISTDTILPDVKPLNTPPALGEITDSTLSTLRILASNPVGGIRTAFDSIGSGGYLAVGLVFCACFVLSATLGGYFGLRQFPWLPVGGRVLKLLALNVVPVVALSAGSAVARKVLGGQGSFAGDVFTTGLTLVPLGFLLLAGTLLGLHNVEATMAIGVFAACYSVLVLHAACRDLGGISESRAPLVVPILILFAAWATKIAARSIFGI